MSIDDDYFDVRNFVEHTELKDSFDRFSEYLKNLEIENIQLHKEVTVLRKAMTVLESPMLDKVSKDEN